MQAPTHTIGACARNCPLRTLRIPASGLRDSFAPKRTLSRNSGSSSIAFSYALDFGMLVHRVGRGKFISVLSISPVAGMRDTCSLWVGVSRLAALLYMVVVYIDRAAIYAAYGH